MYRIIAVASSRDTGALQLQFCKGPANFVTYQKHLLIG